MYYGRGLSGCKSNRLIECAYSLDWNKKWYVRLKCSTVMATADSKIRELSHLPGKVTHTREAPPCPYKRYVCRALIHIHPLLHTWQYIGIFLRGGNIRLEYQREVRSAALMAWGPRVLLRPRGEPCKLWGIHKTVVVRMMHLTSSNVSGWTINRPQQSRFEIL